MRINIHNFYRICSVFFTLYPKIQKVTLSKSVEDGYIIQFWKHNNVVFNERQKRFQNAGFGTFVGMAASLKLSDIDLSPDDSIIEDISNGLVFRERSDCKLENKVEYSGTQINMRWICDAIMTLFPIVKKIKFMQWNSIRLYTDDESYVNMVFRGCGFQTRIYDDFPRLRRTS